jgi:hypothetical protein
MRRFSTILISGALLTVSIAPADAAKPTTVWEDPSGDADGAQGLGSSIPGGWDLVKGSILKKGANLEFTVEHGDMPPVGSGPEATRFLWAFTVDGKTYRFTVKGVDIGKPDIPAGQTTERVGRADVQGHFRLEDGECTETSAGVTFVNCAPLEYLEGTFDAATMSFTMIVPLKSVKAKPGSIIGPGANTICNLCWVTHVAERSSNAVIIDQAAHTDNYKVPKK